MIQTVSITRPETATGEVCPEGKAAGGERGGFSLLGVGVAVKEGVLAGNQG
jgi:hypothetical protein